MDVTSFPSELLVPPKPLIGFCGLDIEKNSIHKSIWDAFNNNCKTDRASVQFKILPPNYEFPVAKPKRPSYEWYHPKGILKRNWMLKHLYVLPAVVVLFQDVEWNDPHWTEKQMQCASLIQTLKNGIQDRNICLTLVLIQKCAPATANEDTFASERAASLTNACSISTKMLFILPHSDHLLGYTTRLECTFLEMAQVYYSQMAKRIRMHRDQLTASHLTLKIRHQFKLGFISEMRFDPCTALKHYSQTYSNLDEIRIVDTNCLEVKTIAGYLNYKICRLMFNLNLPRDAINHFITHTEKYKSRVGYKELLFEHYAWLSTQHSVFAEIFCEAIKTGLPALQTQHPGIYFHKAAEYTVKRKEALQFCQNLSPTELQDSELSSNSPSFFSEYFGIRTLKPGEIINDRQIITLIQQNERNFNHSATIITLLGQAMAQFKVYKCLRFRKKLAIDMAEEYYKCGDHSKALTLYSLMLPDYRRDEWYLIFTDILLKTLRCAFLSASVVDFILCSIEALSLKIICEQKERVLVLENLWKVFQNIPPVSQNQIAPELRSKWENSLLNNKSPIIVDLDKLIEVMECFISFNKPQIKVNESVTIQLYVKISTQVPLKVREINVILTDGNNIFKLKALNYFVYDTTDEFLKNEEINLNNPSNNCYENNNDIKFEPSKFYKIIFKTQPHQFLENVQIQVSRIEIEMGTDRTSAIMTKSASIVKKDFKNHNCFKNYMDVLRKNSLCYIIPTFHITIQTNYIDQTILVNEYFKVTCNLTNLSDKNLENVGISVNIPPSLKNKVFLVTDITSNRQRLHSQIQIDIGEIQMQGSTNVTYYIFSLIETNIELLEKVWYYLKTDNNNRKNSHDTINSSNSNLITNINNEYLLPPNLNNNIFSIEKSNPEISSNIRIDYLNDKIRKTKENSIKIPCISEFKFVGRFYTLNRQPLTKAYCGENFLFRANIEVHSSCDLDILETYFICDYNLSQSQYSYKRKKQCFTYKKGETLEDVYILRASACLSDWKTQQSGGFDTNWNLSSSSSSLFSKNLRKNQTFIKNITQIGGGVGGSDLNNAIFSKIPANTLISGDITNHQNSINYSGGFLDNINQQQPQQKLHSKLIFHKAIDLIQVTGFSKDFIKSIYLPSLSLSSSSLSSITTATQSSSTIMMNSNTLTMSNNKISSSMPDISNLPVLGIFCIKWRRSHNNHMENESKFVISGVAIDEPPLSIYCTVEDKMFVKIPMTYCINFKNSTSKIINLIVNLNSTDNFMFSGHRQLNISIFAHSEKEIVYNLYPLKVGWQNLPEILVEYNTLMDPSIDEEQKSILSQIVSRSIPKRVFVLPPIKDQIQ